MLQNKPRHPLEPATNISLAGPVLAVSVLVSYTVFIVQTNDKVQPLLKGLQKARLVLKLGTDLHPAIEVSYVRLLHTETRLERCNPYRNKHRRSLQILNSERP
jgi:hypothetical protein